MSKANAQGEQSVAAGEATPPVSLLDHIVEVSKVAYTDSEKSRAKDVIGELIDEVTTGTVTVSDNLRFAIDDRLSQLDKLISDQLSEVMHSPEFQKIESSWTGLHYLCKNTTTNASLKIQVLNASRDELVKDFNFAGDPRLSALYGKIYTNAIDTPGASPFGALIGDFEFGRSHEDMYLLDNMARIASSAHAPFITAASPKLLGKDSFVQLGEIEPLELASVFEKETYAKWRSFRDSEDSRYVGLTLPRFLGRLPFHPSDGQTTKGFNFEENVDGRDHSRYLWVNSAYAMGARITNAFHKYGWCAAIRGLEGGGAVEDLPSHTFSTDDGDVAQKCPTEVTIDGAREYALSELGFMPLSHYKGKDYAVFYGAQSAQKPRLYDTDAATANARLSAQLQYMFTACRISHYLKVMVRDKVGGFASKDQMQDYLNRWISNYVVDQDDASQETKARYPLRDASVEVAEVPGKPGVYQAVADLRPHFQLEALTVALRLVAELPKSRNS